MIKVSGYINGRKYKANIKDKNGKQTCPVCPEMGKEHIKDTCLSVNLNKGVFNCHKCGWKGHMNETEEKEDVFVRPDIGNQTELSDDHLRHFSKRLIRQEVLKRNKVKTSKNWFAFNYYDGDDIVKVKYKKPDKKMMQSPNSKPWIYKYNDVKDQKEVIICEGEEETLVWEQAGFKNACSVDMGAPNKTDANYDKKLACITNCFDVFENAERIYLAVDNDENGDILRKELIRRFGAEKCKIVDFGDSKDANDFIFEDERGEKGLAEILSEAKDVKIDGIFSASDFRKLIFQQYRDGQERGTTTYFENIDPLWKWRKGEVNVWTGYNNEGKSMFLRQIQIAKSIGDGWKHAVFSPEDTPLNEWYTDIIESYIGKSADKETYGTYMIPAELERGYKFANKHFYNVYPEDDHSLDSLMKAFSYCVRKYDVQTITLDPYNQIHHLMKGNEREDLYISRFMARLKKFAVDHNVIVNLVAHQVTPPFKEGENYPEPNLYKIKGGGTFSDKADNVLVIWRKHRNTDFTNTEVMFISQKIKKQKLTGLTGRTLLDFHRLSNRYLVEMDSPIEKLLNAPAEDSQDEFSFNNLTQTEAPF